jgi:hypothetical protein
MKGIPPAVLMLALAAGSAAAAPVVMAPCAMYRQTASLELPPFDSEEVAALILPAPVFAQTADDLRDLRVFNAAGAALAWQRERMSRPSTQMARRDSLARILTLKEDADANRLEILFELERDAVPPSGLEILTPLHDFERAVTVEGRTGPDVPWQTLAENVIVFDARRFMDVAQREVGLAKNTCRQFRIVIGAVTDEAASPVREIMRQTGGAGVETERLTLQRRAFRIDRIRWWHEAVVESGREDIRTAYPVELLEQSQDRTNKQTRVRLNAGRAPLTRLAIETPDRNFSRRVRLLAVDTDGTRTPIASDTVAHLQFRALNREQLTLSFAERRCGELELVIENGDNPPLQITGVKADGATYRLLFFVQPGAALKLYFGGNPDDPAPAYDTVALEAALTRGYEPLAASLGPVVANPDYRGDSAPGWGKLNTKWLLSGALVLMVLVLGAVLVRSTKHLDAGK